MEAITTAMQAGLQQVGKDALSMIGLVIPYAIPVIGGIIAITVGFKIFRRVTGR